ncbi:hypothetical protein Cgig2_015738 [Carnegiea gigantea]|uniref:Uncharacterized protein n=1 Tax=Carnegiea gigantea TaxID=171969 RepID=A0A9Q1JIL9_9CARY|nr:hypothetical protein Cgig2_015738 [Carnegiea gigantea]
MTDAITRHVSELVRRAMEAANSAGPLPYFDYIPTHGGKPSHRPKRIPSPRYTEQGQEVSRSDRSGQPYSEQLGRCAAAGPSGERPGSRSRSILPSLREPAQPRPRDEECSTKVMATIAGGYTEGITRSAWKAQLRSAQQEVNPMRMIRLPVHFGDKLKSKSLEVDFLVVDVPTAYNVNLGRPTLHKVKAVIVPYLLQLQFEADDNSVSEMCGDQRTARECYLVSIWPRLERTRKHRPDGLPQAEKRARTGPATVVSEALVIHTLTLSEPPRSRPKAMGEVEQVSLEEERPKRTVQLGQDITALDR